MPSDISKNTANITKCSHFSTQYVQWFPKTALLDLLLYPYVLWNGAECAKSSFSYRIVFTYAGASPNKALLSWAHIYFRGLSQHYVIK